MWILFVSLGTLFGLISGASLHVAGSLAIGSYKERSFGLAIGSLLFFLVFAVLFAWSMFMFHLGGLS